MRRVLFADSPVLWHHVAAVLAAAQLCKNNQGKTGVHSLIQARAVTLREASRGIMP